MSTIDEVMGWPPAAWLGDRTEQTSLVPTVTEGKVEEVFKAGNHESTEGWKKARKVFLTMPSDNTDTNGLKKFQRGSNSQVGLCVQGKWASRQTGTNVVGSGLRLASKGPSLSPRPARGIPDKLPWLLQDRAHQPCHCRDAPAQHWAAG